MHDFPSVSNLALYVRLLLIPFNTSATMTLSTKPSIIVFSASEHLPTLYTYTVLRDAQKMMFTCVGHIYTQVTPCNTIFKFFIMYHAYMHRICDVAARTNHVYCILLFTIYACMILNTYHRLEIRIGVIITQKS